MIQVGAVQYECEYEPLSLSSVPAEEVTRSLLLLVDVDQIDEGASTLLHRLVVLGTARVVTTDGDDPVVPEAAAELVRVLDADHYVPPLTPRELEVARLAVWGLTNREIATRLGTSARTVGNQLQRVYDKLGIHDRGTLRERFSTS